MESTPSDYLFSPNNFIKRTCETPLQTPSTEPWGSPPVVSEFIPTYITYSLICHCVIACCCQAYYTLCLVSASGWALPNYETGKVCFFGSRIMWIGGLSVPVLSVALVTTKWQFSLNCIHWPLHCCKLISEWIRYTHSKHLFHSSLRGKNCRKQSIL